MASCSVAGLLPSSTTIGSAKRLSHRTTRLRKRTAVQTDAGRFVPGVGLTEPVGPPGLSRPQILVVLPALAATVPQGVSSVLLGSSSHSSICAADITRFGR